MDFFNVLIIIAFIAIAVFKQTSKEGQAADRRPRKHRKAMMPAGEEECEEECEDEMPFPKRPKLRMQSFADSSVLQCEKARPSKSPSHFETNVRQETEKRKEKQLDRDISLRNPSEARRAFIYSEIFQRKYD